MDKEDHPSVKEVVVEKVKEVVQAVKEAVSDKSSDKGKDEKQGDKNAKTVVAVNRGDPKTAFDQRENSQHSKAPVKAPEPTTKKMLFLTSPDHSNVFDLGSTTQVNYFYDTSMGFPYDKVIAVYDSSTKKLLSATGYVTTFLDKVPDMTGMTLLSEGERSDGTLAYQLYVSPTTESGGYTLVRLDYEYVDGVISLITQTVVQPLDPKKVKLPQF